MNINVSKRESRDVKVTEHHKQQAISSERGERGEREDWFDFTHTVVRDITR